MIVRILRKALDEKKVIEEKDVEKKGKNNPGEVPRETMKTESSGFQSHLNSTTSTNFPAPGLQFPYPAKD